MAQKDKLEERIKGIPKDLLFQELVTFLGYKGYHIESAGKTGGSRIRFVQEGKAPILVHKPHPGSIVKEYMVRQVVAQLVEDGLL